MEPLYNNFDRLEITFQGFMPEAVLEILAVAKEKAQKDRKESLTLLPDGTQVMVAETGAPGGFRYRFDTGLDGEIWQIAHTNNSDVWGIRVIVKSLALALHGYETVKERIVNRLDTLKANGLSRRDLKTGTVTNRPLERISRFDYCFDFVMDENFMPAPEQFVTHQRAKKHVYSDACGDITERYTSLEGENINTVRIGNMPGRQVILYNKTKEITASDKHYWWQIWGIDQQSFKESFKQIWRVEVRAGKKELDQWALKRFEDFETKSGDIVAELLTAMRYTEPLKGDANRSRWPLHPIWEGSLQASYKAMAPYRSGAIRENIIREYKDNIIHAYRQRLIGNAIGLTAVQGRDIEDILIAIEELKSYISSIRGEEEAILIRKYLKKKEEFEFLG